MQRTYSSEQLDSVAYFPLQGGTAVVLLRDNIEYVEGGEGENGHWEADEVSTMTTLPESAIADAFDVLWVKGETESKPLEKRIAELEELSDAMMAIILGEE